MIFMWYNTSVVKSDYRKVGSQHEYKKESFEAESGNITLAVLELDIRPLP